MPRPPSIKRAVERQHAYVLAVLYVVVGAFAIAHHELWRDEFQSWLIARDSTSLLDLARAIRWEGHPILWYACLMFLTRITHAPVAMQAFNLLLGVGVIFVFAKYSPFSRLQKLLFALGYYALYEYGVISRNYAIGVLLLFLVAALFPQRYKRLGWITLVLALAAFTSAHALILVIAIAAGLAVDLWLRRAETRPALRVAERPAWLGIAFIGLAAMASALTLNPPAESGFGTWTTSITPERLQRVLVLITQAFLPMPQLEPHFWSHARLVDSLPFSGPIQLVFAVAAVAWIALALLRKPAALVIYLSATFGLCILFYTKYFGAIRHHGFFFLAFLIAMWVARDCWEVDWLRPLHRLSARAQGLTAPILSLILALQCVAGITAVAIDYLYPFSQGKAAADFIKQHNLAGLPMVGHRDTPATTIVGYLDKDRIFFPQGNRWGASVLFDGARWRQVPDEEIVSAAHALGDVQRQDVLLVLNHPLAPVALGDPSVTELARFTGSIVEDEIFYLYLVHAPAAAQ